MNSKTTSERFSARQFTDSLRRVLILGGIAVGLTLLRRWLESEDPEDQSMDSKSYDEVDRASEQSFPASDAPSWTQSHH